MVCCESAIASAAIVPQYQAFAIPPWVYAAVIGLVMGFLAGTVIETLWQDWLGRNCAINLNFETMFERQYTSSVCNAMAAVQAYSAEALGLLSAASAGWIAQSRIMD